MAAWQQAVGQIDAYAPLRGMTDQYLALCLEHTFSLEVVALLRGIVEALHVRLRWASVFEDDFSIDPSSRSRVHEEGKRSSRHVKRKTPRGGGRGGDPIGATRVPSRHHDHHPSLTPRSRPQTVRQGQDQDRRDTVGNSVLDSHRIDNLSGGQTAFLCALLSALSGMGTARVRRHVCSILSRQYHQCVGGVQPDPSGFCEMLSSQGFDSIGRLDVGAADANAAKILSQLSHAAAMFARGLHSDDLVVRTFVSGSAKINVLHL